MKIKFLAFIAFFSFFFISCQLEEDVTIVEQQQVVPIDEVTDEYKVDTSARIQCFGQATCSAAVSLGVTTSSEKDTFLIMYEAPNGQPTFQYVTKGSYLNREVKVYLDTVTYQYYFKIWFKNKYVPEPGMQYQKVIHPYTLDGVRIYHMNWSYQY